MAEPTLIDLLAQKAELERRIAQTQRSERAEAIAQVRALMAQHGLTLGDISGKAAAPAKVAGGAKVAAKYRDDATGQTWSGRGLQPNWLKAALACGRSLAEFKV